MKARLVVKGRLSESAARRWPQFQYNVPHPTPVNRWTLDPQRVDPDKMFPRWSAKPEQARLHYSTTCDFEVLCTHLPTTGEVEVSAWLVPSEFSYAVRGQVVGQVMVSASAWYQDKGHVIDMLLTDTFGADSKAADPRGAIV